MVYTDQLISETPNTVVYTSANCPGCVQLKSSLRSKGTPFIEMEIGKDISMEDFKAQYPGVRSVPHQVELK